MKLIVFAFAMLLMQEPDDPPGAGEGTALQCDNYMQTAPAERCHCARDEQRCKGMPEGPADVRMDKRCKTYCKQQHCDCRGMGCRS